MLILVPISYHAFSVFPWSQLICGLFLTCGIPPPVYYNAKSNYESSRRISETIDYEIDTEYIQLIGESFTSKLSWDKIYSVTENKDWILIWQNIQIANVLPKRDFNDADLKQFKAIVRTYEGVKSKLKK